jgi:hypothetical protein
LIVHAPHFFPAGADLAQQVLIVAANVFRGLMRFQILQEFVDADFVRHRFLPNNRACFNGARLIAISLKGRLA